MRVVFSSCLLGHATRYDGRTKVVPLPEIPADAECIHFCPEVAAGLGIPRPCIELVQGDDGCVYVKEVISRKDVTDALMKPCLMMIEQLKLEGVDLFVLKARSPSCGLVSPLHDEAGNTIGTAPGLWARLIAEHFPNVPCVTELV